MQTSPKNANITPQVDKIEDKTQQLLAAVKAGSDVPKPDAEALKKRKLVKPE